MGKFTSISALVISYGLCVTQSLAQNSKVDLGQLSENNGNFRYVAIGSSLSAGVRDGGVYAAAQQTSFPALLAQQMGIKDFKQPLLPGNGTGRKTVTKDKNGNLKFTEIKGLDDTSPNAQLPKVTGDMDNLAVPYQKVLGLDLSEEQTSNWPNSFSKRAFTHGDRFVESGKEKNLSYKSILETELHDFQFYSYEVGIEDFIELFINGAYQQDVSFLTFDREGYFPEDEIFKSLELKGGKGIVLNLPEVYSLPYFNQYSFKTLKNNLPQDIFIERYSKNDVRLADDEDLFLPDKEGTNGLLDGSFPLGLSRDKPLLDEQVIGTEEKWSVRFYNATLAKLAESNKMPIVDLYTVYAQVVNGEYITDDGVIADPSYPGGNFFSNDGLSPTPFGNAIIANECIKVINSFYHSKIELIQTSLYLNK
ncbi:MAG: hypothetical protein NXI00_02550 [Cytophagales bacterium]|nr:hypothetical protein [Cytophagales bacterium]